MPDVREKLVELLCEAHSKATDAEAFADATYAQQLEMEADHLIANGVTIQRWIPVEERLPEMGQEVICFSGGVLKPGVYCYLFWSKDYDNWARVTHWMPLPQPPKEDEDD